MFANFRAVIASLASLVGFLLVNTFAFGGIVPNDLVIATYVLAVLVLAAIARHARAEAAARDGWSHLTASPFEWGIALMALGLTGAFLYVYLFVGSGRADAVFQMRLLLGLVVAFGGVSALMLWLLTCFATRWNADVIEQRDPLRGVTRIYYADIAKVGLESWSGCLRIATVNGVTMRIPIMRRGVKTLLAAIRATRIAQGFPAGDI